MSVISVEKYNTLEQFRVKTNLMSTVIGDSDDLALFANSSNVIDVIRELQGTDKAHVAVNQVIEGAVGWNMLPSDLTDIPASITYTRGDSEVKSLLTWVSGNVTQIVYQYKEINDSYSTILTETITYDDNTGNVSLIGWS